MRGLPQKRSAGSVGPLRAAGRTRRGSCRCAPPPAQSPTGPPRRSSPSAPLGVVGGAGAAAEGSSASAGCHGGPRSRGAPFRWLRVSCRPRRLPPAVEAHLAPQPFWLRRGTAPLSPCLLPNSGVAFSRVRAASKPGKRSPPPDRILRMRPMAWLGRAARHGPTSEARPPCASQPERRLRPASRAGAPVGSHRREHGGIRWWTAGEHAEHCRPVVATPLERDIGLTSKRLLRSSLHTACGRGAKPDVGQIKTLEGYWQNKWTTETPQADRILERVEEFCPPQEERTWRHFRPRRCMRRRRGRTARSRT